MLYNFRVDFFIEFAVVEKNGVHFFELTYYEIVFVDDGFHGDAAAYKHLVDCYKFGKLFVVGHFLKLLYFVLQ